MTTRTIPASTIIGMSGWPCSVSQIVRWFQLSGAQVTPESIEATWDEAKRRGDLPPVDRPEEGFDLRKTVLVQRLSGIGSRREFNQVK